MFFEKTNPEIKKIQNHIFIGMNLSSDYFNNVNSLENGAKVVRKRHGAPQNSS